MNTERLTHMLVNKNATDLASETHLNEEMKSNTLLLYYQLFVGTHGRDFLVYINTLKKCKRSTCVTLTRKPTDPSSEEYNK